MTLIVPLKVFALLQMQLFIQEAYITIDFRLISYIFFKFCFYCGDYYISLS
jgi:hypothetical protein